MEKVFEVFILYMDMVGIFVHVKKLICWNICSCNQWRLGMKADYNWWFCHDDNVLNSFDYAGQIMALT